MNFYVEDNRLKNIISKLSNIYRPSKEDYDKFNSARSNKEFLSHEDIVSSVSITSKIEYEDDMTLKLTKDVLTRYKQGIIELDSKNKVNNRIINAYNAYNYINNTLGDLISYESLTHIHKLLMNGFDDKGPGRIRNRSVYIGDGSSIHEFVKPKDLSREVYEFIEKFNALDFDQDNLQLLVDICRLKYDFIRTHPFLDGNGRTSRMLFQKLLLEAKLPFTNFSNWIREDYHDIMEIVVKTGRVNLLVDFYIYNLYHKVSILSDKGKVEVIDVNNRNHIAYKTTRSDLYFSINLEQIIYANEIQLNYNDYGNLIKSVFKENCVVLKTTKGNIIVLNYKNITDLDFSINNKSNIKVLEVKDYLEIFIGINRVILDKDKNTSIYR